MLKQLHIMDFVLVSRLELTFSSGFTVFSGETGAGKSVLIDAIGFALGGKVDAGVIRTGANRAEVSIEFDIQLLPKLQTWLAEYDLNDDDDTVCLIRRTIDQSGKTRAYINARPATITQLKTLSEQLIDISGQHASQMLLRSDYQRQLFDAQAGLTELAAQTAQCYHDWKHAQQALDKAQQQADTLAAQIELLHWEIDDLQSVLVSPEQWQTLSEEHRRLAYAATLSETAGAAIERLSEADGALIDQIAVIRRLLNDMTRYDESGTAPLLSLLESADIAISELLHGLESYASDMDLEPGAWEELDARLDRIISVSRKYRVEPEEIETRYHQAVQQMESLTAVQDIDRLTQIASDMRQQFETTAKKLTQKRRAAIPALSEQVSGVLRRLGMRNAVFDIELTPCETGGAFGFERVVFLFQANAGTALRPLAKVASGGELSRIGLALTTIVNAATSVPSLIFDEIDVGVGGGVAEIIGDMLKQLGKRCQVFCITHLPQVAAQGDRQLSVSKIVNAEGQSQTCIYQLDPAERIEEIARMLGGITITEITRKHAEEMLSGHKG